MLRYTRMLRRQAILTLGAALTGGCLRLSQSENGAANGTTTRPDRATTGGRQTTVPESSGPDRDPDTVSEDGDPDPVSDDGTDQPSEQSPALDGQVGGYQFSAGERYTYELPSGQRDISMEVTEVVGDQLTVRFSGPQSDGRVVEGTLDEIFQPSGDATDSIARAFFGSLRAGNLLAAGRSLTVGNSWTVTPDDVAGNTEQVEWETATAEVTGTDSYDGVPCANVRFTTDSETGQTTYCLNPEYPFAIAVSADGENTIKLVEHTTG
jgi:hypothetical protein